MDFDFSLPGVLRMLTWIASNVRFNGITVAAFLFTGLMVEVFMSWFAGVVGIIRWRIGRDNDTQNAMNWLAANETSSSFEENAERPGRFEP